MIQATPIRLYNPEHSPRGMTLAEFFDGPYQQISASRGHKTSTRKDYRSAVNHWLAIHGDTPLDAIDRAKLLEYRKALLSQLAAATARKYCVDLRAVLAAAGPVCDRVEDAAALIDSVPSCKLPAVPRTLPRPAYTLDHLQSWLRACEETSWCRPLARIAAPRWWRAAIVILYNTGLRIEAALLVRWEWVDLARQTIDIPGAAMKLSHAQRVHLNRHAVEAIESLRPRRRRCHRVLEAPCAYRQLSRYRRRLLAAAKLPDLGFHGLRRTFATELSAIDPIAADLALNHSPRGLGVLFTNYANRERIIRRALDQLPQPTGRLQLELF